MQLAWKEFKIDLKSFQNMLSESCPNSDGIVACEEFFEVIEKQPLTQSETLSILSYYDGLEEVNERNKLAFPLKAKNALLNCRQALLTKSYDDMSVIERKIILNMELTQVESEELVVGYG